MTQSMIVDHEGSPRVHGDEEEEDTDDLENEFSSYTDIDKQDKHEVTEEMLHAHMGYGHDSDVMMSPIQPQYPLLTNGHMVDISHYACLPFLLLMIFTVLLQLWCNSPEHSQVIRMF